MSLYSIHIWPVDIMESSSLQQKPLLIDTTYTRSLPGILRLVLIGVHMTCFISILCQDSSKPRADFYLFVVVSDLILNLVTIAMSLVGLCNHMPYRLLVETVIDSLYALLFLISSVLLFSSKNVADAWIVAGLFGLFAIVIHGTTFVFVARDLILASKLRNSVETTTTTISSGSSTSTRASTTTSTSSSKGNSGKSDESSDESSDSSSSGSISSETLD